MKRKYAGIILALLIVACMVTFPLIGCNQAAPATTTVAITAVPMITAPTSPETTAATTATTSAETTAATTASTTAETTAATTAATISVAPTIKLSISEGPTYSARGDVCYYRVKAAVTGKPAPTVIFSKDDSDGAFGRYSPG